MAAVFQGEVREPVGTLPRPSNLEDPFVIDANRALPMGLPDLRSAPVVDGQTAHPCKMPGVEGGDGSAEVEGYGSDDDDHVLDWQASSLKRRLLLAEDLRC